MPTASDVVARIKLDFPQVPDAVVLAELNAVHVDILSWVKLTQDTEIITLTAGDGDYALDSDILRVWSARYESAANTFKPLVPTHLDELDRRNPRWRTRAYARGVPSHFYIDTSNLWLYPWPDTTASGGYPRVVLEVSRSVTLTGSDNMPAQAANSLAWEMGVCRRLARRAEDKRVGYYDQEYDRELSNLIARIDARNTRYQPRIEPSLVRMGHTKI